jgi:hypothetical protein
LIEIFPHNNTQIQPTNNYDGGLMKQIPNAYGLTLIEIIPRINTQIQPTKYHDGGLLG